MLGYVKMSLAPRRSKRRRKSSESTKKNKKPRLAEAVLSRTPDEEPIDIFAPKDADWTQWVSATQTRNYLHNDPVLDWIKTNYSPFVTKNPVYTQKILKAVSSHKSHHNFTEFIMEQGNIFESQVIRLMCNKFGADMIKAIGGELNARSPDKVQETLDAMNQGVPFIHGGLLHNPENQTYGIPDLLVRSDWLNKLVTIKPLSKTEYRLSATRLTDPLNLGKSPKYHYRVVDVKFTTLSLRSDGVHLLNSRSFPAYKSQLWIYNEALARMQGYKPSEVYLLGRRWRFTSRGETFIGTSCFDRLGVINYITVDSDYPSRTLKAIQWVKDVNKEESRNWNVLKVPLERPELYPNMSNSHDYPWHSVKKKMADEIGEITTLWMVGVKNRKRAHDSDVYKWTDPRCTTEVLGVNGEYTSRILKKMIDINRPRKKRRVRKIRPSRIKNNFQSWKNPQKVEFYVDFETVNDILTDFSDMPAVKTTSLIFMIGVGHINPLSGKWSYCNFVVDSLTLKEEGRICSEFSKYIRREARIYGVDQPDCIHWAPAENRFWNGAISRHSESDDWCSWQWDWLDLMQVFKQEPIVIEGCMGFGLKKVAKAMYNHKFIKTTWNSESSCLDGRSAMIGAWKAHKEAKARGTTMRQMPEMGEIAKYNEVDIKVMQEITQYLRKYHT